MKLHHEIVGKEGADGGTLLCLAGFASSNWIFRTLADRLQQRFKVVMPDNRGMGQSPLATAPFTLADMAADALAVMDDLGEERFFLVGTSMGGFLAQLLTLAAPERVRGMALLCASSSGPEFAEHFPVMTKEQVTAIYQLDPKTRAEMALSEVLVPCLRKEYPAVYEEIIRTRIREYEDLGQVLLQYDAVTEFLKAPLDLAAIRAPALILTGDRDLVVPPANARLLQEKLSGSTLQVVENTDHLFFLEKPDEVGAAIAAFFDGLA